MERKMRRRDAAMLHSRIAAVLRREEPRDFDLNYPLVRTKARLRAVAEELSELEQETVKGIQRLAAQSATKGPDGKPLVDGRGAYQGLAIGQCPEYDAAVDAANAKLKAFGDEMVAVEVYAVKESAYVDKRLTGAELDLYEELRGE